MNKATGNTIRAMIGIAACLCAAGWFYLFDPDKNDLYIPCPWQEATGLDCPGCGTQHALHMLLRARPADAFAANPLAILILPLTLYVLISWYLKEALGISLPEPRIPRIAVIAGVLVILTFWVFRNLPCYPYRH
jgi:hypothetical protein